MDFRIREAVAADSPFAAEVVRQVFEEYGFTWEREGYSADLYDLDAHYLSRGDAFWVAESSASSGIVATCGLELFPPLPGPAGELIPFEGEMRLGQADCALQRLYVLPSIRRGGIGSALFETAIREARTIGKRRMEIWSDKKLTLAHRLYERYGAVRFGERICDDPDQSPEWGMALDL